MKYLAVILLVVSCAMPQKRGEKKPTYAQKMEKCIFEMMEKFSINAEIAFEVCEGIHKNKERK